MNDSEVISDSSGDERHLRSRRVRPLAFDSDSNDNTVNTEKTTTASESDDYGYTARKAKTIASDSDSDDYGHNARKANTIASDSDSDDCSLTVDFSSAKKTVYRSKSFDSASASEDEFYDRREFGNDRPDNIVINASYEAISDPDTPSSSKSLSESGSGSGMVTACSSTLETSSDGIEDFQTPQHARLSRLRQSVNQARAVVASPSEVITRKSQGGRKSDANIDGFEDSSDVIDSSITSPAVFKVAQTAQILSPDLFEVSDTPVKSPQCEVSDTPVKSAQCDVSDALTKSPQCDVSDISVKSPQCDVSDTPVRSAQCDVSDIPVRSAQCDVSDTPVRSAQCDVSDTPDKSPQSDVSDDDIPIVDLTQDISLQNSPVGAKAMDAFNRSLAEITSNLSEVTYELDKAEALLESVDVRSLPDGGKTLIRKIDILKQKKRALLKERDSSPKFAEQEKAFAAFSSKDKARQTSLHDFKFPKQVPATSKENSVPWGELPTTDATLSGFGRRAMQTHLTEKSLTVEALSKLHTALKTCPSEDTYADDPKGLRVELMPHQRHALAWLLWREKEKPAGGILADDMGLGKTLTMISLILKSREERGEQGDSDDSDEDDDELDGKKWMNSRRSKMPRGGTLVVCPASLISQWEGEITRRCERRLLNVVLYHSANRETKPRRLARADVVITTYNLMARESGVDTAKNCTVPKVKGPIHCIKWERVILDEAHVVRNHKSQMAVGVIELAARYRWCLTGTPIQNRTLDLYSLLKFLRCSPFDDLFVWKRWVDNKNAAGMQRLNTMMKSLMLRRTKEELQASGGLKSLPEKTKETIDVHLDPEELELYEKISLFSKTLFSQFLAQRAEKQQVLDAKYGMCNLPTYKQGEQVDNQFLTTDELVGMHMKMQGTRDLKSHELLVLLLRLRQVCCHPGLIKAMIEKEDFGSAAGDETAAGINDETGLDIDLFERMKDLTLNEESHDDADKEMKEERERRQQVLSLDNPILSFERPSAKIKAVLELLEEKVLGTTDKAVIVSQWTSMLRVILSHLKEKNVRCVMLSGDVPVVKRQDIVADFNKSFGGAQILLLSLSAGGVGLNLVGGNHLMLVDIHWNPQLEAQACDRIYRVGQKKPVFIYRFITIDTVEERIRHLQDIKLSLADSVLSGTNDTKASKLSLDDLKMLFGVGVPSSVEA